MDGASAFVFALQNESGFGGCYQNALCGFQSKTVRCNGDIGSKINTMLIHKRYLSDIKGCRLICYL